MTENYCPTTPNRPKFKSGILSLAIIALVAALSASIGYFIQYSYNSRTGTEFEFIIPQPLDMLSIVVTIATFVLLLVCAIIIRKQKAQKILFSIVFSFLAFGTLWSFLCNIIDILYIGASMSDFGVYTFEIFFRIVITVLAVVSVHTFSVRVAPIIATSVLLFRQILSLAQNVTNIPMYIEYRWYIVIFTSFMWSVAYICMYVALLLISLNFTKKKTATPQLFPIIPMYYGK